MAPRELPSFSKILLRPSDPHLTLPQGFVLKHLQNKIVENVILRSVNGGYSWKLEIKKLGENYCFINGWNDVVEDSRLEFGDFLVFWLVDPSTFKLSIYSPSGCEMDFPVEEQYVEETEKEKDEYEEDEEEEEEDYDEDKDKEEEDDDDSEEEEDDDVYDDGGHRGGGDEEEDASDEDDDGGGDIDGDDGDPFFMAIITKYNNCVMRLPRGFTRSAGIGSERTITLKSLDETEWPVRLLPESRANGRYYLSAGWSRFRQVNQLSEGDECVFKFIMSEDKLCLARVTKKRAPAKQPAVKVPATVKRDPAKQPAVKVPATVVKKRSREVTPQPAGEVPASDVLKRTRVRPPPEEVVKRKLRPRQPASKSPAAEVTKRLTRRSARVEVVEKERSRKPAGKAPATEVLKRKRH